MSTDHAQSPPQSHDVAILNRVIDELFRAASAAGYGHHDAQNDAKAAARRLLYLAAAKRLHERCAALESKPSLAPRLAPRLPTEARRRSPIPNRSTSHRLPRLPARADQDATPVGGSALV